MGISAGVFSIRVKTDDGKRHFCDWRHKGNKYGVKRDVVPVTWHFGRGCPKR